MPAFLKAIQEGEVRVRRWRLMVLGGSGDGKSTMIDRLLGKGFKEQYDKTNAAETECKVEITHCNEAWKPFDMDQVKLLDEHLTDEIDTSILADQVEELPYKRNVDRPIAKKSNRQRLDSSGSPDESATTKASVDARTDPEIKKDAAIRLNAIRQKREERPATNVAVDNFLLSIWDLAGQVVYYILHAIFLRWHCVYILVVNLSTPLDSDVPYHELPPHNTKHGMKYYQQIEFFLNMIYSHRKRNESDIDYPNVLIVGTHKDKLAGDKEENAEKYFMDLRKYLKGKASLELVDSKFIAVDSLNGDEENYTRLRSAVFRLIRLHCSQSRPRPIRWLQLEKRLLELRDDVSLRHIDRYLVSYERALELGKQFHIETDQDLLTFLGFHHLTGDLTYCKGDPLGKFTVPHPQWLIDIFKALITLQEFLPGTQETPDVVKLRDHGLVNIRGNLLDRMWERFLMGIKKEERQHVKSYLLNLLTHFDLAIQYSEHQYMLPCMLPIKSEEESFMSRICDIRKILPSLYIRFHASKDSFDDFEFIPSLSDAFLPHGVFQRLLVKCVKQKLKIGDENYQNAATFHVENDVIMALKAEDASISIQLYIHKNVKNVMASKHLKVVASSLLDLLNTYHPNAWYDICVNVCEDSASSTGATCMCLRSIGPSSMDMDALPHLVTCQEHGRSLSVNAIEGWFSAVSTNCVVTIRPRVQV